MKNNNSCYGKVFIDDSWGKIFMKIKNSMENDAAIVDSRIGRTKELINPVIILTNPQNNLFYNENRKFSLIYAIVEAYKLFSDDASFVPFAYFNKKMEEYSDDGKTLNSAYGQYIAPYIENVCEKLKKSHDSRQAVIRIYDSHFGLEDETKDVPCTLDLHFMIRDNKLNLTTYMRSNDLIWGLQYDLFVFTALQQIVANEIGIEVGNYIHCPTSLHVYEYHWDLLKSIKSVVVPKTIPFFDGVMQAKSNAKKIEQIVEVAKKFTPESVYNNIIYKTNILRTIEEMGYNNLSLQMKLVINEVLYKLGLIEYADLNCAKDIKHFFKRWYKNV